MIRAIGFGLALTIGLSVGSSVAMASQGMPSIQCSVERADKLPAGLSADDVCAAIRAAADPEIERARLSPAVVAVKVTVESDSRIAGAATVHGRALPEHRVGISDRSLNARAIAMLATAIAAEIASASK